MADLLDAHIDDVHVFLDVSNHTGPMSSTATCDVCGVTLGMYDHQLAKWARFEAWRETLDG